MKKKVIVVGAGVSGLASAIRLQHLGYDVEIYEKNPIIGGRMGLIEFDGFKFDLGPTILMMPHMFREVFEFCGRNPDDYLQMERLDPIYQVYFSDGTTHAASSELSKLVQTLEAVSEADAQGFLRYLSDVYERYLVAKEHFIGRGFRTWTDLFNPKTLMAGLKLKTFNNAYAMISEYVKDEKLRELLSFQTLYIGISPFNGPSIYTIIPMIELVFGVWFLKGGMRSLVTSFVTLFEELGGKIHVNAPVSEIRFAGRRATGVVVAGEHHAADYVISTADFPYAMKSLLPANFRQGKYKPVNVEKYDYACSCFMQYIALDTRDFPDLDLHNLVFSEDFSGNIHDIFDGNFPQDPSIYVYAPALLDESLAPEGQLGLYVLTPVPNLKEGSAIDWTDESTLAGFREKAYEKMRRIGPLAGFEKHILREKVYTPLDYQIDFNAFFGATFGLRPTLMQSNSFRPQPKATRYDNLYFAGSSSHPGAGVPIVLMSAQIAVNELLRDAAEAKG
ncbi:MAG: phytoene desaturase family protein [Eubacteriales bacterium]|nr:phytoene desaturase family protein [Eubacteriales bacterium]